MSKPQKYEITAAIDFLKIPAARRENAYKEFSVWVTLMDNMTTLEEMGLVVIPSRSFTWVDDCKAEARLTFENEDTGEEIRHTISLEDIGAKSS